jgi:hypothetical protein
MLTIIPVLIAAQASDFFTGEGPVSQRRRLAALRLPDTARISGARTCGYGNGIGG